MNNLTTMEENIEENKGFKILCPFCNKEWTNGMLNGQIQADEAETAGCIDVTGKIEIQCEECKRIVYVKEIFCHK